MNALPDSFIRPALARALEVERALGQVAKTIELELSDITLRADGIPEEAKQQLRDLGRTLGRMSSIGMVVAKDIASVLGEEKIESTAPPYQLEPLHNPKAEPFQIAAAGQQASSKPASSVPALQSNATTINLGSRNHDSSPKPHTPAGGRLERVHYAGEFGSAAAVEKRGRGKKFEGELYEAVIRAEDTPTMELREGMEPIHIEIVSDNSIVIKGKELKLEGDRLFIFNALMKLRNHPVVSKGIRGLGFRPGSSYAAASQALSKTISPLLADLKRSAGIELVKRLGEKGSTRYAVNPAIVLTDKRAENVKKN